MTWSWVLDTSLATLRTKGTLALTCSLCCGFEVSSSVFAKTEKLKQSEHIYSCVLTSCGILKCNDEGVKYEMCESSVVTVKKETLQTCMCVRHLHVMALSPCIVCGLLSPDKHRKLLLLFCCLCSKGSVEMPLGRRSSAQLAEKARSQNRFLWSRKRIVSSPAPHCIRHPQQTPSLRNLPPVVCVFVSWPHRKPGNHRCLTIQEKWIIYTSFSAVYSIIYQIVIFLNV